MARSLYLPYRATNPRTVRGAKRRGWTAVSPRNNYSEQTSWMGLNIWAERSAAGYWVSSFSVREFAFEKPSDATAFLLKWG
jgi:hypothetical protein